MKAFRARKLLTAVMTACAASACGPAFAADMPLDPTFLYSGCSTSTVAKTKYPIVLASGVTGAPNWPAPGGRYWYQIPDDLCSNGATVYVANLPAVNTDVVRGEELVRQIKWLMATLNVDKVNLIGHSQGSITVCYAAATFPQGVASVTTIAGPHKGTEFSDFLLSHGPVVQWMGELLLSIFGPLANLNNGTSYGTDADSAVRQVSPAGMVAWNQQYPTAGISSQSCAGADEDWGARAAVDVRVGSDGKQYTQRLYSWTGNSPVPPWSIDAASNTVMLAIAATMAIQGAGRNDGIVGVCSSRFGTVLGTYNWNHGNEINQFFGLVPLFEADPKVVFRNHASRLKNAGL